MYKIYYVFIHLEKKVSTSNIKCQNIESPSALYMYVISMYVI